MSPQECIICLSHYNEGEHKPIILHCGHSFCHACLVEIKSSSTRQSTQCPTCRSPWHGSVASLPVCYQLIPTKSELHLQPQTSTDSSSTPHKACEEHGFKIIFWCKTCGTEICKQCVAKTHKRCDFILSESAYDFLYNAYKTEIDKMTHKVNQQANKLKSLDDKCLRNISLVNEHLLQVQELMNELVKYRGHVKSLNNMVEVNSSVIQKSLEVEHQPSDEDVLQKLHGKRVTLKEVIDVSIPADPANKQLFKQILSLKV